MSRHKGSIHSVRTYSAKAVSAVLAGTMVLGIASPVLANEAVTTAAATTSAASTTQPSAAASVFRDVKTGFWAEKHIYKLASQGIVIGNNGLFRPGDPVTQQEAVLMALRFMKLQDGVDNNTNVVLPTDFKVSNYYKGYVVLAFQQGLLDKSVEMAADNLKTPWGERKASREWIAEVLIRALGKSSAADAAASEPTGFADDAKVSASKRGYINAAVDLGLANGLEGNRFDPQGAVTRAQLATFFSRAQAHNSLVYDNTVSGIVSELKDGKMTIFNNGTSSVYNLAANTAYFNSTSENRISLNDIQPYTKVTVIGATNNAAYVELTDPTQQVETFEGEFAKISPGNKLWLESVNSYNEFDYDAATSFEDAAGNKIEPTSITAGSLVTLLRETYSGSNKTVKVKVTTGVVNKTVTGTIQSIDLAGKSITFKNASGAVETFKWEEGVPLFSSKNAVITAAELKVNSAVKYSIKDNMIRTVEVTEGVERTVQGSITELTSSTIVYKKADGTREVKLLASSPGPVILIPNLTSPVSEDLIADATGGDNVQITLNSSEQVTKIEVLSRQIEQYNGASIVDYNSKTQLLTIMDSNKKAHVVQLDEKTKLVFDGVMPTLKTIDTRLTENRKVNVKSIGQRALSLDMLYKYEGTVTAINPAVRTMVIKVSDGQNMTLPYPQSVDIFGNTNAVITDVPIGSAVTASLNSSQDLITVLRVRSVVQLEAATVNSTTNKLGIKWTGGSSELNMLTLPLTNEAGQPVKLSELKSGDYINITFDGSTPLSVQTVKLTYGGVSSVDTAGNTITLRDFAGVAQTLSVSGGVKIIRDSATSTTLGSLTSADRVEVRKDADGSTIVRILPQLSRTYSRYDSVMNELVVKRDNINDNNYRFRLAENVYIHQGDTTLSVQSLKENDKITVYFINNVIVEIVKQ